VLRANALLFVGLALILFGAFNLTTEALAQDSVGEQKPDDQNDVVDTIVINLISQIGPIVAGFVSIGISFAKKQGLKISAEAEAYFVNSASSFVVNQGRFLYKTIRDNPEYLDDFKKGMIPAKLKEEARNKVIEQLKTELHSDEFTKAAKSMLEENLVTLVERSFTEHKNHVAEKTRSMLKDLVPIAVNAALLGLKSPDEVTKQKEKIIEDVLEAVRKSFDLEDMLLPQDIATTHIKSELNKIVGSIKA
jgi:hypothetical protein